MFNGNFTSRKHWYENCSTKRWPAFTLLETFAEMRKATSSFVMHVPPSVYLSAWKDSAPTRRTFMKFDIWMYFRKSVDEVQVSLRPDKNIVYYFWRLCTFMIISRSFLIRMRSVSGRFVEKSKSRILCLITFFVANHPVYEIMWKNTLQPDRPQVITWRNTSFSSLSYDRSKASSKASCPHSAIQSFLFQMRVSSPFLKVIQYEEIQEKIAKAYEKMKQRAHDRKNKRKHGCATWKPRVHNKVLVRTQPSSDAIAGMTGKFIRPYEWPYMITSFCCRSVRQKWKV